MNTPILVHVQLAKFSLGSVFSELSQLILWPAKILVFAFPKPHSWLSSWTQLPCTFDTFEVCVHITFITVVHSQTMCTKYNTLMRKLTLTAALSSIQVEKVAFCLKILPNCDLRVYMYIYEVYICVVYLWVGLFPAEQEGNNWQRDSAPRFSNLFFVSYMSNYLGSAPKSSQRRQILSTG